MLKLNFCKTFKNMDFKNNFITNKNHKIRIYKVAITTTLETPFFYYLKHDVLYATIFNNKIIKKKHIQYTPPAQQPPVEISPVSGFRQKCSASVGTMTYDRCANSSSYKFSGVAWVFAARGHRNFATPFFKFFFTNFTWPVFLILS